MQEGPWKLEARSQLVYSVLGWVLLWAAFNNINLVFPHTKKDIWRQAVIRVDSGWYGYISWTLHCFYIWWSHKAKCVGREIIFKDENCFVISAKKIRFMNWRPVIRVDTVVIFNPPLFYIWSHDHDEIRKIYMQRYQAGKNNHLLDNFTHSGSLKST